MGFAIISLHSVWERVFKRSWGLDEIFENSSISFFNKTAVKLKLKMPAPREL
jgi:hypothetical protein